VIVLTVSRIIMMKSLTLGLVILGLYTQAYATRPFPSAIFVNDGFTFVAGFPWPDQDGNVLIIRTMRTTASFSIDALGLTPFEEFSLRGYQWYQNAIGYVATNHFKAGDEQSFSHIFYFRHRSGKDVAIDLGAMQPIEDSNVLDRDALDRRTISKAARLLRSQDPRERQTAAIHLGQLRSEQHLPQIMSLLGDPASYTRGSGADIERVYYVREAAEKAIRLIQEAKSSNQSGDDNSE